jgi:hypothetical protein
MYDLSEEVFTVCEKYERLNHPTPTDTRYQAAVYIKRKHTLKKSRRIIKILQAKIAKLKTSEHKKIRALEHCLHRELQAVLNFQKNK